MPSIKALITVALLGASSVTATWGKFHQPVNWGCGNSKAPQKERDDCSSRGSFFTYIGGKGKAVCCSEKTKTPPRDIDCPIGWYMHKWEKCCIPPKEVNECDCGEGFTWNSNLNKCTKNKQHCKPSEWWHERSKECVPNTPSKGDCPKGKTCPKGWYWCKWTKKCRPETPHTPAPDCDDWNDNTQCCEPPATPSGNPKPPHGQPPKDDKPKPKPPHGQPPKDEKPKPKPQPGHGHDKDKKDDKHGYNNGHHWKRTVEERVQAAVKLRTEQEQLEIQQEELNAMYCPGRLQACSVNGTASLDHSWSYECIDTQSELESCGGCASTGEGVDCTALPGVRAVTCNAGQCEAYNCATGFKLVDSVCVAL
ncbi:hypothetical protein FFLO_02601 [Filobasidium floriforme]|uniref:Protein CPL1-like domain-containing protein n=1 Tax=Filobasidium floriforme TaxID=5210 RepID=A0A8K0NR44_9TREE|nr:uncharacterized protein HD553DRAFT_368292 [Filobasidium floriforme]KAG7561961.1 hypothetical protein FFLO_02601 [Filobasidium floriforme]KAH8087460.1 hypothetical protein HD553DRAFT_368292 [Filobasidium floriforme]